MTSKKKFGEILVDAGVITDGTLRQALDRQQITGWRLGKVLEAMEVIAEKDIAVALSKQYGFRSAKDFAAHTFTPELLDTISLTLVKKFQVFPLMRESRSLYVAMVNPLDLPMIAEIEAAVRLHVIPVVTTSSEISAAIHRHYDARDAAIKGGVMIDFGVPLLMVIDTSQESRVKLVSSLKKSGFLVIEAENEAEAVALSRSKLPHLALVDTVRPLQLNPQKILADLGDIPLIAIGPNPVKEEVAFLNAGFVDFVHKPFHQDLLLARINRALRLVYGEAKGKRKKEAGQSA